MEYAPPEDRTDTLRLASGRTLAWKVYGGALPAAADSDSAAVAFYFHGTPGSRLEGSFFEPGFLEQHNVRMVAIDRPGMGLSTHYPERRILDWPADVLAVADHLGVDQFHVLGVSGGGPYALACAYSIPRANAVAPAVAPSKETSSAAASQNASAATQAAPAASEDASASQQDSSASAANDTASHVAPSATNPATSPTPQAPPRGRLLNVAIASGMYPATLGMDGMLPSLRVLFTATAWLPRAMTAPALDWMLGRPGRDADPDLLFRNVDREMATRPEAERAAYADPKVRRTAVESLREAFRSGGQGPATEMMLLNDWGFELSQVDGRGLRIWHGVKDMNVPFAMAQRAARLMPGVQTHFFQDEGHLSLSARRAEEILVDLLRIS